MSLNDSFGVSPEEVIQMARVWRAQAAKIEGCNCTSFAEVRGPGSDVFLAVQGCADPATNAGRSIATRLKNMADLADRFAADAVDVDLEITNSFTALEMR